MFISSSNSVHQFSINKRITRSVRPREHATVFYHYRQRLCAMQSADTERKYGLFTYF
jgi:hypothetical protein